MYKEGSIGAHFVEKLFANGLWEKEAREVVKAAESANIFEQMKGKWNDRCVDYPKEMLGVMYAGIKQEALKWINENAPNHYAREMFMG